MEASDVPHGNSRRLALAALAVSMTMAACGGSSTAAPTSVATAASSTAASSTAAVTPAPSAAPPSTGAASAAAGSCPSAAVVGAGLGISLPNPVSVPGGGGTPLPAGATGVACEYHGAALNVLIQLITNIDPSSISKFSARFPVPYVSVSGVGDQARSFLQPLNGGKNNEGVVATKGQTLVAITATATPATLAQIEALISQLL